MTEGQVLDVAKEAIYTIIICSAPMLIISLVVGLIVSIFQTVTSIQEQTLTFVPKIIAVFVGLMIFGSWILTNLTEFVTTLWSNFSIYLG
ncbi:flagellar biosynthesis protein FliQ [Roseburia intestinalis]|jgi:flagellar biosynthetic protein FliQ|uniref:Flagellar biosynthetic protein FliQ n=1 Tax=Roseburia intestinalis TaxID=166486 RepID=A0A3R6E2P6_9FIRM|nr:flagellar biosynthesis protein FliQ [Roseburia intestinalis]RHC20956.1 flagellar biosynthetic protein FliQ [Roseburia intestinalis]